MSVLLFLGLFMAVPLWFHLSELGEIDGALETLQSRGVDLAPVAEDLSETLRGPAGEESPDPGPEERRPAPEEVADGRLAQAALRRLKEVAGRAARYGRSGSAEEHQKAIKALGSFTELWDAFKVKSPGELREVEGVGRHLHLEEADAAAWQRAFRHVRSHRGERWTEDPFNLHMSLRHLQELRKEGRTVSIPPAVAHLKREAVRFKRRLDGVSEEVRERLDAAAGDEGGEGGPGAPAEEAAEEPRPAPTPVSTERKTEEILEAEIRDTQVAFLEMLAAQKHHEIVRTSILLAVGALMALFFARILWNDVLSPLGRLRRSINNMAMSGMPTPVETHGPPEVAEVLQAYNRLIDTVAAEGGTRPEKIPCSSCHKSFDEGDSYCRWCGVPAPASVSSGSYPKP